MVDDLRDMMMMNGMDTFPSHTGCSSRLQSRDLVEMLRIEIVSCGGKFRRYREEALIVRRLAGDKHVISVQ